MPPTNKFIATPKMHSIAKGSKKRMTSLQLTVYLSDKLDVWSFINWEIIYFRLRWWLRLQNILSNCKTTWWVIYSHLYKLIYSQIYFADFQIGQIRIHGYPEKLKSYSSSKCEISKVWRSFMPSWPIFWNLTGKFFFFRSVRW